MNIIKIHNKKIISYYLICSTYWHFF